MSENARRILMALSGFLLGVCLTIGIYTTPPENLQQEVSRSVRVDTITYLQPVARDSVVVRYVTARLPLAKVDTLLAKVDTLQTDSVAVQIPITQHVYRDSAYTAWVSGYRARLDSIQVYQRTETVRILERPAVKRFHIGPCLGYGVTPAGLKPYVGVSITYSLISL